ncbi:MAG: hypothetical protein KBA86_04355 [Bacteroidales bacterium]|nr:hypothetical protein [Bacteroidales bacterium]
MLTKKKKQNLLFLGLGIIIGCILAGSIAYFSVIKQFTKGKINKIQLAFPIYNTDSLSTKTIKSKTIIINQKNDEIDSVNINNDIQSDSSDVDTNIITSMDVVKTDTKIESMIIPIINLDIDSTLTTDDYNSHILVEQWENPTNFAGYRKNKTTLIIYGISIENIELQSSNNTLFLVYKDQKLGLQESNTFIRFPSTFLTK